MSASILTLPPELLSQILENSDYASRLALRYTSKCLYLQTLTTFTLGSTAAQRSNTSYNISDLLQVEKWPCYDLAGQGDGHLKPFGHTRLLRLLLVPEDPLCEQIFQCHDEGEAWKAFRSSFHGQRRKTKEILY